MDEPYIYGTNKEGRRDITLKDDYDAKEVPNKTSIAEEVHQRNDELLETQNMLLIDLEYKLRAVSKSGNPEKPEASTADNPPYSPLVASALRHGDRIAMHNGMIKEILERLEI